MVFIQWCGPKRGNYLVKYSSEYWARIDIVRYKNHLTRPIAIFKPKPTPSPVGKYEDQDSPLNGRFNCAGQYVMPRRF